jgi:hypothetical protein
VVTAATAATTIEVRLKFIIFTPNLGFGFVEAMLKPYSYSWQTGTRALASPN